MIRQDKFVFRLYLVYLFLFVSAVALLMLFCNALYPLDHLLLTCWRKAIGKNVSLETRATRFSSPGS